MAEREPLSRYSHVMSGEATHDELFKVVLPDERYEAARRDELGSKLAHDDQCFSCAFFHVLAGERGMDWGVCFNPRSPRHGLLNFEHYGCAAWEQDESQLLETGSAGEQFVP